MSKVHVLKTVPPYFDDIISGAKTFEVRRNDRDFKVGDTLRLREWNADSGLFMGRVLDVHVSYVLPLADLALADDFVVMGLAPPTTYAWRLDTDALVSETARRGSASGGSAGERGKETDHG